MTVSKVLAHRLAAPPAAGASSRAEVRLSAPVTAPSGVGFGSRDDTECRGAASAIGPAPARWPVVGFLPFFFLAMPTTVATALPAAQATEDCGIWSTAALPCAACSSKQMCQVTCGCGRSPGQEGSMKVLVVDPTSTLPQVLKTFARSSLQSGIL